MAGCRGTGRGQAKAPALSCTGGREGFGQGTVERPLSMAGSRSTGHGRRNRLPHIALGGSERSRSREGRAPATLKPAAGAETISEVELGAEDDAAGIGCGRVSSEIQVYLAAGFVEAGGVVDTGELGVVEEVVELEAQLQAAAAIGRERDVLKDRYVPVVQARSAVDVFGCVADAEECAVGGGDGINVECAAGSLGPRVRDQIDATVHAGARAADDVAPPKPGCMTRPAARR